MSPCRKLGATGVVSPSHTTPPGHTVHVAQLPPRLSPPGGGEAGAKSCLGLDGGPQKTRPRPNLGTREDGLIRGKGLCGFKNVNSVDLQTSMGSEHSGLSGWPLRQAAGVLMRSRRRTQTRKRRPCDAGAEVRGWGQKPTSARSPQPGGAGRVSPWSLWRECDPESP